MTRVGAVLALLTVFGSTFVSGIGLARAVNPSYFYDSWQGCAWQGATRLMTPVSQAFTNDNYYPCLDLCYLYGQWINSGGTYYTYYGSYSACDSYAQYTNSNQTELYGEHSVIKNNQVSSTRSTDATR